MRLEGPARARSRRLRPGPVRGLFGGVAVVLGALILVTPGAMSLGVAQMSAPYKGASSQTDVMTGLLGCGSVGKIPVAPAWGATTGLGKLSLSAAARACHSVVAANYGSTSGAEAGWTVRVPVVISSNGWHSVQTAWYYNFSASESLSLARCPAVVLFAGHGSQECWASSYWQIETSSYLLDLTNGTATVPLTLSVGTWYNTTSFYNYTSCTRGTCTNVLAGFGGNGSGRQAFSERSDYNATMVARHHYSVVFLFETLAYVNIYAYPRPWVGTHGSASFDMAGSMDHADLSSITVY